MHREAFGELVLKQERGSSSGEAGEVEREARIRPDRLEGYSGTGLCDPGFIPKEREGTEGLRSSDMTRLAFREVVLAAAWRTD